MTARLLQVAALMVVGCALCSVAEEPQKAEAPQTDAMPQVSRQAKQKVPTGTLTGTVYCADTNLPARRAQIYLIQYSQSSFGQSSQSMTDLDGRFAIKAVREGDYYVVAVLPGYVNLLSSITKSNLDSLTEDDRKKLLAQVASATISADQPADVSVRLERGTEIDGTVTYDDGSPAIGLEVIYKLKVPSQETGAHVAEMMNERFYAAALLPIKTDDRGRFRILGVPPGEYLVSVSVPTASAEQAMGNQVAAMLSQAIGNVNVYVGGGLRASKAETIKIDATGASGDADIIIPLSKLHTIRGRVVLKSTGQHPPLAMVQLLYADNKEPVRAALAPDGEFEMRWVPEGNFILRAAASSEPLPNMDFGNDEDEGAGQAGGLLYSVNVDYAVNANVGNVSDGADLLLVITGDVDNVSIGVPDPPAKGHDMQGEENQSTAPVTPNDSR